MSDQLPESSRERCESIVSYVEDMSAWYDEKLEDGLKIDYAREILARIDRKGELNAAERAYCESRINELFA